MRNGTKQLQLMLLWYLDIVVENSNLLETENYFNVLYGYRRTLIVEFFVRQSSKEGVKKKIHQSRHYIYYIYVLSYSLLATFRLGEVQYRYFDQNTVLKQIIRDYAYIQTKKTRIKYKLVKANICKYSNVHPTGSDCSETLFKKELHTQIRKYEYSLMKANSF
jgi:hypothetical protein